MARQGPDCAGTRAGATPVRADSRASVTYSGRGCVPHVCAAAQDEHAAPRCFPGPTLTIALSTIARPLCRSRVLGLLHRRGMQVRDAIRRAEHVRLELEADRRADRGERLEARGRQEDHVVVLELSQLKIGLRTRADRASVRGRNARGETRRRLRRCRYICGTQRPEAAAHRLPVAVRHSKGRIGRRRVHRHVAYPHATVHHREELWDAERQDRRGARRDEHAPDRRRGHVERRRTRCRA